MVSDDIAWRNSRSSHAGHQHPPDNPPPPSVLTWSRQLNPKTCALSSIGLNIRPDTTRDTGHEFAREVKHRPRGRASLLCGGHVAGVSHGQPPCAHVPGGRPLSGGEADGTSHFCRPRAGGACFIQACRSLPPGAPYRVPGHVARNPTTTTREKTNVAFRRMRFCWCCCCHTWFNRWRTGTRPSILRSREEEPHPRRTIAPSQLCGDARSMI